MDMYSLIAEVTEAVLKDLRQNNIPANNPRQIPVGISNRHVHLAREDLRTLFGGSPLEVWKDLSQPGQFAALQQVALAGPKNVLPKVRVLGPERAETQVEISPADAVYLGLGRVPVRESGQLEGTPGLTLVGPAGAVTLKKGVIIAARHIHMHPRDALFFSVADKAVVSVKTRGARGVTFHEVIIRVSEKFKLEFHVDLDEANAAYLTNQDLVEIV